MTALEIKEPTCLNVTSQMYTNLMHTQTNWNQTPAYFKAKNDKK